MKINLAELTAAAGSSRDPETARVRLARVAKSVIHQASREAATQAAAEVQEALLAFGSLGSQALREIDLACTTSSTGNLREVATWPE